MGKFYAIGAGPGDPGLLTLKAVEILRRVQVIYHAGSKPDQGRAWSIVRSYVRPDQEVRVLLAESMAAASASDGRTPYQGAVNRIAADCRPGKEVALVTEGDPTLYSTAANVWQLLETLHPDIAIEIVPGVSSITAAAARVHWPLAQKDETFAVIPAGYQPDQMAKVLDDFSTVCLLKVSQVSPQVLSLLENDGEDRRVVYLENLGTDQEWVTTDLREAVGRKEYFSQILVRRRRVVGWGGGGGGPPGGGPHGGEPGCGHRCVQCARLGVCRVPAGTPRGAAPARPREDRHVMRVPRPVRVLGSLGRVL
jgi:precorrin-2/cobalt-factor-2 C20-methyltransferase